MSERLTHVAVPTLAITRFRPLLDEDAFRELEQALEQSGRLFAGRVVWNVNSTARGGGVAELLASLLPYARGADVDARWTVISGDESFFAITKCIHNQLHGFACDHHTLGTGEREIYEKTMEQNAAELRALIEPGDVAILHDPQTAGLAPWLRQTGCRVVWRCHVGVDNPNDVARSAWRFLLPYVDSADALVFSRDRFVWEPLDRGRVAVIPPSIDVFSPKNQDLDEATIDAILAVAGFDGRRERAATFKREDGSPGRVERRATLWEERPLRESDRVVLQVSRWDALKDPVGVIRGFAEHVAPHVPDAHLVYAGPAVDSVADDPQGALVLAQARSVRDGLEPAARARVHLAAVPMDDQEENAAIINALQRRSAVIVQKSVAEGFGLTAAEGMWKSRPVVASRIGGLQDQIVDGESGVLLDDPGDLAAYGGAVTELLRDPGRAAEIGAAAHERVRTHFLGARELLQYFALLRRLLEPRS